MALSDTAALIASLELQDKFSSTVAKYDRAVDGMSKKTSTLERVGFQTGRGLRAATDHLKTFALVGGGLAVAGIIKSINAASNLNESLSKSQVVFGDSAAAIEAWSKTSAEAFGLSQQAALETAGTFGNLFTAMGIGDQASTDMSKKLVELAADLASFNNLNTDEVLVKLRAGIVGEAEPLRTLGVQISAARTEAEALKLGMEKVDGEFTASQKAIANYNIILEDTKKAQGDFARTSDGLANSQRILRANMENTFAIIGGKLTPAVAKLTGRLNDLLVANQPAIAKFAEALPGAFDQLVSIVERLPWGAIGSSLELAGKGAKLVLDAFTAMPDWVQTAVLTGWGLNKFFGGAPLKIGFELLKGPLGGLFGRGGTPATPLFTKEVGIPGTGGPGAPIAGAGPLAAIGGLPGLGAILATIAGGVSALTATQKAVDQGQLNLTAALQGIQGPAGLIERAVGDLLGLIGIKIRDDTILGGKPSPQSSTPLGQFTAANAGGTPIPVKITEGSGAFNAITIGLKFARDAVRNGLRENDIHAARFAQKQLDSLNKLRGEVAHRVNDIVPHLGKVNRGLSTANRNLEQGNTRQRELAQGIREARSSLQTGFTRTNANLGVSNSRLSTIAAKDFSPNVNVSVNASTSVSISEVARSATTLSTATSLSSQTRHGFLA